MDKLASSHTEPAATRPTAQLAAFDEHAVAIAKRQYFTPQDKDLAGLFRRVAAWVATPEGEAKETYTARFFDLMASKRFCPGGRVLAGAATSHGNVLNCFVQDGSPETAGTDTWVLKLATKLALVTKVGGGNGLCLDPLKPKRAYHQTAGQLYLTISPAHADYDKVKTGTYMDLVHGKYVAKGYRRAVFVEQSEVPSALPVLNVGDSVEKIWGAGSDMIARMLRGEDVLLDLSNLRPEGTPVKGSGGTSSGPSSFAVEVFDNFAVWAALGGANHAGPVATLRYIFAPTLRVIRQGGCLHPDTLVNTSKGTLRLRELVDAYQYGWQDHALKVATDEGWKESPRGFNNGNVSTLKVTLGNGQEIQGTPNHKLKVMCENGERRWVALEDLQQGDSVIQVLDQHTGAAVTLAPLTKTHHNTKPIRTPEQLDERLAFFLGYLWGDGFVSGNRVGFAVAHGSPMMKKTPELFSDLFGLEVRLEQKENDKSAVFVASSAALVSWLGQNGLAKGRARELTLPKAVRQAPRPVVGAFLRGLFEADGSVTVGYPTLASASKHLLQDVTVMLAGLGIPSTLRGVAARSDRYSKQPMYHVKVVSAKGRERFLERVGFIEKSRFETLRDFQPDTARESSWPLPHASALLQTAFDALPAGAKSRPSPYTSARKNLSRYIRGERQLTATGLERLKRNTLIADKLPEFDFEEFFIPVKSVEDGGRSLTLDLSVAENKTYLANGVVSHNTRRGAGMATMSITHPDIQDFITAKDLEREQLEGDISTFNISVLVSDTFMNESRTAGAAGVLHDIADHAWQTGEPGLIFIDRINEYNPLRSSLGDIKSTNPCVTADTWVGTQLGPRQVRDLIGKRFCAVVDGKAYAVESAGFWSTGVKPIYTLETKRGFKLRLTGNHKLNKVLKTHHRQTTAWTEVADLCVGDAIALQNHREVAPWPGKGTVLEGWLLGSLVGDGTFVTDKAEPMACLDYWGDNRHALAELAQDGLTKLAPGKVWKSEKFDKTRLTSSALAKLAADFGIEHRRKTVTDEVEKASHDFYCGFLRGLFDADGSPQGEQEKGVSVRLAQSNLALLERVQRMLARLGILSSIYSERRPEGERYLPDGRGGSRAYFCQADHELVIANDNLEVFQARVGFEDGAKRVRLARQLSAYRREPNRERFSDKVVTIEAAGTEEVFDVTVEHVHAFDANGISAHNCGEIPLFPGEPCDLGAINLAAYIAEPDRGVEGFDWDAFHADVTTCIRFLDNVLEVNKFALADNREMSLKLRRLGLGVMGLADALILMGLRYDSDAGRAATEHLIAELRDTATQASEGLAAERGPFPACETSSVEAARRNIALLTVAPTGTTSMLMGVSSGIEPVFAPFVYRKIGDSYASLIHPLFQELLERHAPHPDFQKNDAWDWDKVVAAVQDNHGSVQGLAFVPDAVKDVLVCAHDIAPEDHVKMQGVIQTTFDGGGKMVANSISKTINMPNEATVDDVYDAYSLAFATGCKGITVYRDGSRQFQVLSTKKEEKKPVAPEPVKVAPTNERLPGEPLFDRPGRLSGFTDTVKLMLPNGEKRGFYVTVNSQDGLPTEVFIVSGKAGDEANADSEALGRMVSIALQYGVPAAVVIKTLRGINGGMYGTYQGRMVASKADLLAVALETAGVENVLNKGATCPDCAAPLRFEEGCQKCESCGYSKCG